MLLSELLNRVRVLSKDRLVLEPVGPVDVEVARFNAPAAAGEGDIAFLTDPAYAEAFKASRASVLVLREKEARALFGEAPRAEATLVLCDNPYAFFAFAGQVFHHEEVPTGVSPQAFVAADAHVDPSACIEPMAVVKSGARVGARTVVKSGAVVAERVTVGEDCILYPNVVLERDTVVGDRCIFQPGCVIGADGFGFAPFKGEWVKIPQTGRVVIGDDVEVGANTTIDRGALEDTVVGSGTKFDNQIQIGHNVHVGEHCVMAACTGVAGSTRIGAHTIVGGAANINGHISIPAGSTVGPASNITSWSDEPATKMGFFPAMDVKSFQLTAAIIGRLPQIRKDLKALEREVASLRKD